MLDGKIAIDDPRAADVRALLGRHLSFAYEQTPPDDVHALDVSGLLDPAVTFCGYRRGGTLLAVGALKQLDRAHGELKSMHTAAEARGRGIGRAVLEHLLALARECGCRQVSLETGTTPAFAAARSLYARAGFVPCGPFAGYQESPNNTFMTLPLDARAPADCAKFMKVERAGDRQPDPLYPPRSTIAATGPPPSGP